MKTSILRVKACVTIVVFLILPFTDITKPFNGIELKKVMGSENFYEIQELKNYDLLQNLLIIPEDTKDKESLVKMIQRINKMDRTVLELLVNQRVKVRLFEGSLTDEPLLYYLKWNKPRGWKSNVTWDDVPGSGGNWLISAKIGASMPGNGHGSINLELHEIGHTVFNLLETSPKFAKAFHLAWQEEKKLVFPKKDYFLTYPSEYFSEVFAYYYYSDKTAMQIRELAPATYQLLKELKNLKVHSFPQYF